MIIQKLASAIRRQDWFQVVIEVLIVIVGIFLGLQVSEWNEQRIERTEEVVYLNRLLVETKASLATNEMANNMAYQQWQDAYFVAQSMESCTLSDQDKDRFVRGLWFAGKVQAIELSKAVVDELKSTGKYQILRDVALRDALTELESIYNNAQVVYNGAYSAMVYHWNIMDSNYSIKIGFPDPAFRSFDFGWTDANIDFESICSNEHFKHSFNHVVHYTNVYFGIAQTVLAKQRDVISILEQNLQH